MKARELFNRVPERVPQVQLGALARFLLVAAHDVGLHAAAVGDDFAHHRGLEPAQGGHVALQARHERLVAQKAILDHLGNARAHLAGFEGLEYIGVDQNAARLMKGADEILARGEIDARLAAHAAVDLCEKRSRNLHEADAAHPHARGKSRHVAHDTAAQGHHEALAVKPGLDGCVKNEPHVIEILVLLAVGQLHHAHGHVGQSLFDALDDARGIKRADGRVGHKQNARCLEALEFASGRVKRPLPDVNRIGARTELNVDFNHFFFLYFSSVQAPLAARSLSASSRSLLPRATTSVTPSSERILSTTLSGGRRVVVTLCAQQLS